MQTSIRERAEAGAAVMVSSHLLSLVEDLCSSILLLHRGQILIRGNLADLRAGIDKEGGQESLEALFFRLTEGEEIRQAVEPSSNRVEA